MAFRWCLHCRFFGLAQIAFMAEAKFDCAFVPLSKTATCLGRPPRDCFVFFTIYDN